MKQGDRIDQRRRGRVVDERVHARDVLRNAGGGAARFVARKRDDGVQIRRAQRRLQNGNRALAAQTTVAIIAGWVARRAAVGIGLAEDTQIFLRDFELIEEAILEDIDLAKFVLTPEPRAVIAHVTHFERHVFGQFALNAKSPGMRIAGFEVGIEIVNFDALASGNREFGLRQGEVRRRAVAQQPAARRSEFDWEIGRVGACGKGHAFVAAEHTGKGIKALADKGNRIANASSVRRENVNSLVFLSHRRRRFKKAGSASTLLGSKPELRNCKLYSARLREQSRRAEIVSRRFSAGFCGRVNEQRSRILHKR